jgi:hypothetical protein
MYASVVACPGGGAGERKGGAPAQQGAREGPGGRARAHQGGAWAQQGAREGGGRGAYVYKKKKGIQDAGDFRDCLLLQHE